MRHGEAGWQGNSDMDRTLTDAGVDKVCANVEKRRNELQGLTRILTSPYLRARQTADLMAKTIGYEDELIQVDWLVPDAAPQTAIDGLAAMDFKNEHSVALCSHQPLSSAFVEALCGIERGYISMGTANLVAMETELVAAGLAELLWHEH